MYAYILVCVKILTKYIYAFLGCHIGGAPGNEYGGQHHSAE